MRVRVVPQSRFERPTCPLGGDRSLQLSYRGIIASHYALILFKNKYATILTRTRTRTRTRTLIYYII